MDKNPINSRRIYRVLFISTVTALLFSAINPPIILGSTYSPGVNSSQLHTVIPPQVIGDTVLASQPVTIATETTQVFFPGLFLNSPVMNGLQLNIPQLDGNLGQRMREAGIFWFGKVTPTENYADVRVSYNAQSLLIAVAVFDRLLWADTTPTMAELTEWDAVSMYLSTDPRQGTYPDEDDYKFVVQVNRLDPQAINSRAFFQGDGSGWQSVDLSVSTTVGFRSSTPPFFNDQSDDHGWMMTLEVPFAELGLSGAPPQGSRWRLAARIHDRDDAHGTPIADKVWPVYADEGNPSSWGTVNYGLPTYSPPVHIGETELTIRHRVDGVQVVDGMVGGNSTCGQNLHFWTQWGFANYSGATQVNVQNQWDVADQPCFSKYYIKMPLDQIPPGKVIISSTLTLFHFGNSFPEEALPSIIQVFTIDQEWQEASLNWNNAPEMLENISRKRVEPLMSYPGEPGVPITWDVSLAVARAYQSAQPLNLVFYDADTAMHSGKYFHSSDVDDYIVASRPLLHVIWGNYP